jgi:hypothetical protein
MMAMSLLEKAIAGIIAPVFESEKLFSVCEYNLSSDLLTLG